MTQNNLPWIQVYIDMTLNDHQMLQKMIELIQQVGTSLVKNTKTNNSFIVIKKNTSFIQSICSILFRSNLNIPKVQVTFRFKKNQYNRLVEIKALQGYHNESETLIITFLKKIIPYAKSIKIFKYSEGYFMTIENELEKSYMEYIEREGKYIKSSNIISINMNKTSRNINININNSINNSRCQLTKDNLNELNALEKK